VGKPVRLEHPPAQFEALLPLSQTSGSDRIKLSLTYYYCQEKSEGLCKVGSVAWTVPLEVDAGATQQEAVLELKVE
jgi:hypothetical protein